MRDRDLDLIAALVEGRLDDETEALALIESSPEARAEFEAQRLAYDALSNLGPATMTAVERSALHRDVWGALRTQPAEKATSVPWYARWLPAAAGVFALVLVGVVATLGGGGQDAVSFDTSSDLGDGTTMAAAEEGATDGDAGGDMAPLDAPTSTVGGESGAFPEAAFFSAEAARIRSTSATLSTTGSDDSADPTDLERCLRDADLDGHVVADTVEPPDEIEAGTVIAAVPEDTAIEEATVTFVDRDTCEIVYVDE